METKQQNKIIDGRMMQGICSQWFYDEYRERKEFALYMKLVRLTFGYKKRFAYIKQSEFELKSKALKAHRDWLTEQGIISWKQTKGYTMYKVDLPIDITNFLLNGSYIEKQDIKQKENKTVHEKIQDGEGTLDDAKKLL